MSEPFSVPFQSMKLNRPLFLSAFFLLATGLFVILSAKGDAPAKDDGFTSIFDGKSLEGWDGDASLWRAEDGMIVGETKGGDEAIKYNQFLIWKLGELDDFELKLDYKIDSGNSGIQVRSFLRDPNKPYSVGGYQADIDAAGQWVGTCYGEGFRGILAKRGQKATMNEEGKPEITGSLGDPAELGKHVKKGEWNGYHIIAKGHKITIKINGHTMSELIDNDTDTRRRAGLIAFQLHQGPPMKVAFKNIRVKRLPLDDVKKIVFVAGKPSHAPRAHEHNAGCLLLSKKLNEHHGDKMLATTYTNGWPSDPTAFHNADAMVMYADGGQRHPAFFHLKTLNDLRERGVGIGAIHYAVEMIPGVTNDTLASCIGGAFETDYSVNPHWDADYRKFPEHPVSNGVEPFKINDEWYFNMRFVNGMKGVTPILSSVPPAETMARPDGHHSGNPEVRKMVADKKSQHLCWVYDRKDGGRGFGFTGAHFHDNWANDSFRKTVLNAVGWIAKIDIPENGIETATPTKEELDANLDPKPQRKPKPKPNPKGKKEKPKKKAA